MQQHPSIPELSDDTITKESLPYKAKLMKKKKFAKAHNLPSQTELKKKLRPESKATSE